MLFVYNEKCFPDVWNQISSMIEENYSFLNRNNFPISLGAHNFLSVYDIKKKFDLKKLIVYQLEPLVDDHWWKPENIIKNISFADEIWDYDIENIQVLKNNGINAKFRPILYCNSLKNLKNHENPDIDILFYGTLTSRRLEILKKISLNIQHNIVIITNLEGKNLEHFISRSKIILNIHANKNHRQEQIRINYLLTNNKCIISEKSNINYFDSLINEVSGDNIDMLVENFINTINRLMINDSWRITDLNYKLSILDIYRRQSIVLENLCE